MTLYDSYLQQSNLPKRYWSEIDLFPTAQDANAFSELGKFRDQIKEKINSGANLLICSNYVGNGKTTWSSKILKSYLRSVEGVYYDYAPGLFINVTSFLNEKRLAISDPSLAKKVGELEKSILKARLVIFDDVGVRDLSAYDLNNLYYWIDYRTSNLKSCIYTSNLLPQQLRELLDPRLYDRIVNYSQVVQFQGGSERQPQ